LKRRRLPKPDASAISAIGRVVVSALGALKTVGLRDGRRIGAPVSDEQPAQVATRDVQPVRQRFNGGALAIEVAFFDDRARRALDGGQAVPFHAAQHGAVSGRQRRHGWKPAGEERKTFTRSEFSAFFAQPRPIGDTV